MANTLNDLFRMKVLKRFLTYFCVVAFIFGVLDFTIDLPGGGPGSWLNGFLFSLFVALAAVTFENKNRHVP